MKAGNSNEVALCVFARPPVPGRVKTRLAASIGAGPAAEFYEGCLRDVLDGACSLAEVDVWVYHTPLEDDADRIALESALPAELPRRSQRGSDLGQRLENAGAELFAEGYGCVAFIGTDSPSLPVDYLTEAVHRLRDRDVVLGPAEDGGYYLIGLSRWVPDLFRNMPWSEPQLLGATMKVIRRLALSVHSLPTWWDIDTVEDLHRLRAHLEELAARGAEMPCPRVQEFVRASLRDA